MRQSLKEWHRVESVVTGLSTDFHDVLSVKEAEDRLQRDTYMLGEGRWLAKSIGR